MILPVQQIDNGLPYFKGGIDRLSFYTQIYDLYFKYRETRFMTNEVFTVIGSRGTRKPLINLMRGVAYNALSIGHSGRSGCAPGGDQALNRAIIDLLELGYGPTEIQAEIYIPWRTFQNVHMDRHLSRYTTTLSPDLYESARRTLIETGVCKNIDRLDAPVQKLFARNVYQIVGLDGVLTDYIMHTGRMENDRVVGGTSIATQLGQYFEVPLFNMADEKDKKRLWEMIGTCLE